MAEGKRSKYDTDPLDPDFVRRTEEIKGEAATKDVSRAPTESARRSEVLEEPTRRLEAQPSSPSSYPSVFVPPVYQPPPTNYTTFGSNTPPSSQTTGTPPPSSSPFIGKTPPSSRPVPKLGLPENVAQVLPYAPFYIGIIASLVELLLVPRSEVRTRFHAAQGLALQLSIMVISFLFGIVGSATGSGFGGWLFSLAAIIFLIVSMVRVWQGESHRIAPLGDLAKRINEQVEPRR